jgi:membrane-bound metal-dependent hydrolase YbcI (DUF457 family)
MVGLAYLPDIASFVLRFAGLEQGRVVGHSLLFAVVSSVVAAPALVALGAPSLLRGWLVALLSVLCHDLLDLLQSTDRMPLWPFSHKVMGFASGLIPGRSLAEAAIFGPLFLVFLIVWGSRGIERLRTADPAARRRFAAGWMAASALMLVAAVVHKARDMYTDRYEVAARLLEQRRPEEALKALEQPEDWLSNSRPGRADYLRAEAHRLMGDRATAEKYYLSSYATDPDSFWTVADLAGFYASSDLPAEERERLVAPYLARLQRDFRHNRHLPRVLARIARHLAAAPRTGSGG